MKHLNSMRQEIISIQKLGKQTYLTAKTPDPIPLEFNT